MFDLRTLPARRLLIGLTLALGTGSGLAQEQPASQPADREAARNAEDPTQALIDAMNKDDNGLTIDRAAGTVDITGKVCLREAEFLEMLACTPDTREHESLIVLGTQPSTIHTALLLLGLEPGSPATWETDGEGPDVKMVPAKGPTVEVAIIYEKDGDTVEVPANAWIVNQKTSTVMEGASWIFAGSRLAEFEGRPIYVADSYGTALSLVNFGDDLLARKTQMSDNNASHNQTWGANTKVIPAVGTEVVLRLKATDKADKPEDDAPAEEVGPAEEAQ